MLRRSLLAGLAALTAGRAVAQVSHYDDAGNRLGPPAPMREPIPHAELTRLWADIRAAPNADAARDAIRGRYGRFPWVFRGVVKMGPDHYVNSTVVIFRMWRDEVSVLTGFETIAVEYEVQEPKVSHVAGIRLRKIDCMGAL